MFVSLLAVQAKPEHREELFNGMKDHARDALANSKGCLFFNIVQDGSDENRIWLYEIFASDDDFWAHTKRPYSQAWMEKSRDWRVPDAPRAAMGSHTIYPPEEELKQALDALQAH